MRAKYGAFTTEEIYQRINLRGAVADEYSRLTHGLSNNQILREAGPVLAGVLDTKTGQYFFSRNSGPGELPDDLVPLLSTRIEDAKSINYIKSHGAGTHAEVHALNNAFRARDDANLSDLMLYTINSGQKGSAAKFGTLVPRCPHCEFITDGVKYFPETLRYGK